MPLRDDLLNPIPGENPSGESLRYAPVYDQIKEARREDDEISQGDWQLARKKADWVLVTKLCSDALAKKSKDLQLAAWLTEALARREGYAGLNGGLELIRGLLENFWDTLYPELEDGDAELRATPLDWVGSRLDDPLRKVPLTRGGLDWLKYKESRGVPSEADAGASEAKAEARNTAISEGKMTPEEFDADFNATPKAAYEQWQADLDACLESTDALNALCEEKFGDVAPNYGGLRKTLEELKQTLRILLARKREAEPDAAAPAAAAEESSSWGGYSEEPSGPAAAAAAPARAPAKARKASAGPEPVDRDDAIARVESAARFLRQNDAYNPAGYMLLRGLRWGELRANGSDVDASLLEAPDSAVRQDLKRLFTEGEYQQALDIAEEAMGQPCGRGWLDLQRYAVRACDNLGYYQPAAAIRAELRALLADLPGLLDMTLLDDTPVANAETRAWIEQEIPAAAAPKEDAWASAPAEEPAEPADGDGVERPPDVFELALEACRSGRAQEGIEMLAREAAQEPSARARFQRKVQLAQLCLGAGHESVAYPILEGLAQEIETRRLEDWEAPDMIAHALALLFRSMKKIEVSAQEKQKVYSRICRLDPVQALAVSR